MFIAYYSATEMPDQVPGNSASSIEGFHLGLSPKATVSSPVLSPDFFGAFFRLGPGFFVPTLDIYY